MTRGVRRIDWAALGASIGSTVFFAVLLSGPVLMGAHYSLWLIGPGVGIVVGVYLYIRRERYAEPGPDADEIRFPR